MNFFRKIKEWHSRKQSIRKAKNFSKTQNKGQPRKYTFKPFFNHPKSVAKELRKILKKTNHSLEEKKEIIQAGYLHDVVEDTHITIKQIEEKFGKNTAKLVQELTSNKETIKKIGKANYLIQKMNAMSSKALLIKLVDRKRNLIDLMKQKPSKEKINETKQILKRIKQRIEKETEIHKKLVKEIEKIMKLTEQKIIKIEQKEVNS
jgi:(p)ppGpp synthase/HD superfamily hydrolase